MGYMNPARDDSSTERGAVSVLLVESGLVTGAQLARAGDERAVSGVPIDEVLVSQGVIEASAWRTVLARAWNLPAINLARTHVDNELVDQWPDAVYLDEGWFPVRDQANGTVLVATSCLPDDDRSARIAALIGAPLEFAVVASACAARRRTRRRRGFRN
jgi:hypothetical protein